MQTTYDDNYTAQGEDLALMASSKTPEEWESNCKKISEVRGGRFPPFLNVLLFVNGTLQNARSKFIPTTE